ncbi:MAG: O-acetylhomoserine aminocarboxypropyltransferase [Rickettsiales bacterium]|nr:O-acetylhomoserine aminocarboxypropyltransferase [Rickettsiales bacterium]OUV81421.1 MAG: O-acetylhomoserine aminocarboxypropyltransferase [Rickettsiales bacterium TMED131]|tara:strand:+ start:206 stop:1501 length:1296 start_codon:yes stop_codon:yes gene_type:complete
MKKKNNKFSFNTLSVHSGQKLDKDFRSRALPIYQTTSYSFESFQQASSVFNLEIDGHIYSRISNPTVSALEERLASLEGGIGAICVSSGQAALHLTLATLLNKGDHIISSDRIYGGSRNLMGLTLKRFGIETTFIDLSNLALIKKNIKRNTKLIFSETIGNPRLEVLNVPEVSKICKKNKILFVVDNTIATPFLFNPINFGADMVIHSATKFIGGHGVAIGGVVIDSGNFDWKATTKYKNITAPYEGYNNLNYFEEYGPAAFLMRARSEGLRDFGAALSPQNAFYLLMGVETLGPRMMRHVSNCEYIASYLSGRDEVSWISYPGLKSHKDFQLAAKLMPKGTGAIVSFGLKGGKKSALKFIENLKIFSHLANIGDAKSLVIHPASTTHSQLNKKDLKKSGITEDLIRLSIGIEDLDDLLEDLSAALKKINR